MDHTTPTTPTTGQAARTERTGQPAAEPEVQPELNPPPTSSSATTTYQPHLFQPAHPDDRGGGGGALGGGTSAANECTGASPAGVETQTVSTEGEGTAKCPRSKDTVNSRCANCDTAGPVRKCSNCRVKHYCGRVCQRVSRAYSARKSRARACSRMTDDGLAAPLPPPGALHVRWAQEGLFGDGAR